MADVETKFKAALEVIQSLPKNGSYKPSPEMMLLFYSYYKQATEGRCNRSKPWSFDIINKAKWDAWHKLGDMPKEEAMENYVKELMKVMKEFPRPTNDKIIEALPASDEAADFVQSLGHFYEIIDPNSHDAKQLKLIQNMKKTDKPLTNGAAADGMQNGHVNGDMQQNKEAPSNGYHRSGTDSEDYSDNRKLDYEDTTDHTADVNQAAAESDDEFCDTTTEIVKDPYHENSPSTSHSSPSSISSTSLTDSPNREINRNKSFIVDGSPAKLQSPQTRGGQHGSHGIDEPIDTNLRNTGEISQIGTPLRNPADIRGSEILGSAGGGGERNPFSNDRQSEVQERIAVALLQLQRDMHSVLNRLTTLETITISRQQDQQFYYNCVRGKERKSTSWGLFDDLSPRTTLFIILWPFVARFIISFFRRSMLRKARR